MQGNERNIILDFLLSFDIGKGIGYLDTVKNISNGLGFGLILILLGILIIFTDSMFDLFKMRTEENTIKDAWLKGLFTGIGVFTISALLYYLTKDSLTLSEKYYHLITIVGISFGVYFHQKNVSNRLTYSRVIGIGLISMATVGLLNFFRFIFTASSEIQNQTSTGALMLTFIGINLIWGYLFSLIIGLFYSTPELKVLNKIQDFVTHNRNISIGIVSFLILGVLSYQFFFAFNPKKEAKTVANQYCELQREEISVGIELKNKLIASMTDDSKTQSYRNEYNLIYQKMQIYTLKGDSIYQSSYSKADDDNRYKFQEAYNLLIENCNKDIKAQLKTVDSLFETKMNAFQTANERKIQENSPYSLVSVLKSPNCYLELATKVLNVRDVPSKNSGNVVGQIKQGFDITQLYSANQQIDERGIPWYYVTDEGISGWICGLY